MKTIAILAGVFCCLLETQADEKSLKPIPDKLVVLSFDDCNKSDHSFVADVLKEHGFGATFYVTEGLGFLNSKTNYTTWKEIRELDQMGFEIGNHTRSHPNVARLSKEAILGEVRHMEVRFKEHGIPLPKTFCYPEAMNSSMM